MLTIIIPGQEYFNNSTQEFEYSKSVTLNMEHSLLSVSKWEAKWRKAFLSRKERTSEETMDYFRCMTIGKVDPTAYDRLTTKNVNEILEYINEPMTAVYFSDVNSRAEGSAVSKVSSTTSEVIYYYMIALGIPFECEKWHLNRLLSLIHVCEIKNTPPKKLSKSEIARRNYQLNQARKAKYGTRG